MKDLGPLLLAWGASLAVLFLERDMGASLLLFGVFVVMLWVASGRVGYLVIGLVVVRGRRHAGYLAFSHVQARVDAGCTRSTPPPCRTRGTAARAELVRAGDRRPGRDGPRPGLARR